MNHDLDQAIEELVKIYEEKEKEKQENEKGRN